MPQNTNLNVSPYYDDFDPSKNYKRVLFKPGVPVQARELTTLQSILQDQIEKFGEHFFKEGSMIIPGSIAYDSNYYAVKIEPTFFGVDVENYTDELIGLTIQGKTSGITAVVKQVLARNRSTENATTLYIKYQKSSTENFSTDEFLDGENLVTLSDFTYGSTTISAGSDFATCFQSNATATGSAFGIDSGVYFARGEFIEVSSETIVLDQYDNTPSYRVGFFVNEQIITAVDDPTLYDNAQGFSNYTAPGADRLKISLSLIKKSLDDFQDENFIELFRVRNGEVKKIVQRTVYSEIAKELARRTFDESGDYYVDKFDLNTKESLNDRYSTFGVFFPEELTDQGNTPSKDLMEIQVGPGKAYVKGYEVETFGSTFLDVEKPRTTLSIEGAGIPFQAGNLVRVNNIYGSAQVGLATTGSVDLRSERLGSDLDAASGQSIGRARVYDYKATNSGYVDQTSQFDLYLYDIQTDTEITLNQELALSAPALIEGKNSGARGYLRVQTDNILTLHQTSGDFIVDEAILVNGIENGRVITKVTEFDVSDIKSVRSEIGIVTFSADTVLEPKINYGGQGFVVSSSSGSPAISTITSTGPGWTVGIKSGDIVSYARTDVQGTIYNRVVTVVPTNQSLTIEAVEDVTDVATGSLPGFTAQVSGLQIVAPRLRNSQSGFLYAEFPNQNIESVDLTTSDVFIRREYRDRSTSAQSELDLPSLSGTDFVYAPFDEERYTVSYKDGTVEALTSDQFVLTNGAKGATISGLSKASETGVIAVTTQQKSKVTSKTKILNRAASITVTGSKYNYSGVSTAVNDGLTFNTAYGTRVQDSEISLNVPDVVNVHAVFESSTNAAPTVPKITLSSLNGPNSNNTDLIVGEILIGSESGASAMVLGKTGTTEIFYVAKNTENFIETEEVVFQESGVKGNISQIDLGDADILRNYSFDTGQRLEYYDFGRLIRNIGSQEPSGQLRVFFDHYTINSSDNGEIITTNSYPSYDQDVPSFNNIRNTDVIDFRPRVANYSGTLSPFEFESRDFGTAGQTVPNVIVSDENIVLDYNYYVGRRDRLFLNQDSTFTIVRGTPAEVPVLPDSIDDSFELARIDYRPYVYDVNADVTIDFRANKRYTMRDIGLLEDRLENLEYYTSLSLLETKTEGLVIQDPDTGLDKFKSGFVVDNFSTFDVADKSVPILKYDIRDEEMVARTYFDDIDLLVGSESLIGTNGTPDLSVDVRYATDLGSPNIKKGKNLVTLNYAQVEQGTQTFASRVVNINPFDVVTWRGRMALNPETDVWVERRFNTVNGGWGSTQVISTATAIPNMRAQNIEFVATRLKPGTEFYSFFSRTDMSDNRSLTVPKLLEVTPVQGAFQIGETVVGRLLNNQNTTSNPEIRFRLAAPDHKDGPYDAPTFKYANNPYSNVGLSSFYSETTEVLNIDTGSLNQKSDERFFGYVVKNMRLVGETSNAEAIVKEVRLVSDNNGVLVGSVNIPGSNPTFANGTNNLELSAEKTPNTTPGVFVSGADANFFSQGTIITQTTVIRRARPAPAPPRRVDPIAQSFLVEENPGCFFTSVDCYFYSKSATIPVELQIVTVENGVPTQNLVPGASVVLDPGSVNVSDDASAATTFTFDDPVYCPTGEYAFVLLADTDAYNVWISRVGEEDISTKDLPEIQKIIINKQPSLGSLFKSQNASTWSASQLEDLKFVARKAEFTLDSGTFRFYNPELQTYNARNKLETNAIEVFSKKTTIGLSSAITAEGIVVGSQIRQDNVSASGFVESLRGAIGLANTGLNLTNAGVGYSNSTYNDVSFTTLTGSGSGAAGIVTVTGGTIDNVCVTNSGFGYAVGDTLTATLGSNTLGANLVFTVGVVTSINTFALTNVTGAPFNTSDQIQYVPTDGPGVGIGSTLFSIVPTTVTDNTDQFDGTYFKVNQANHGMHADNNLVKIEGASGDTVPTTIQVGYAVSSIENISIGNSTNFNMFEGAQVTNTNPGFALVGDEIIAYTGVGNNLLTGITTRGIDGTTPRTYAVNTPIQKYEVAGVSLRKINTTHNLVNASNTIEDKVNLDHYHVKITGNKNFNASKLAGGTNATATGNIQFDRIVPSINHTTPNGTNIAAQVRTVSATSVDGAEISFQDKGYESVSLEGETKFTDPRMVASRVNEESKLLALPGAKSFTFELSLSTTNKDVSPVVNAFESFIVTESNRTNSPIANYVTDRRSNLLVQDPHDFSYLTKIIALENPATSLKVIFDAFRPAAADIRVLYRLFRVDGSEIDRVFELMPGFDNLDNNGQVINLKNNSGRSDRQVSASLENQFLEYTFTGNNLPQFSAYQIKVECTTTNQAQSPRIKNFRGIALA